MSENKKVTNEKMSSAVSTKGSRPLFDVTSAQRKSLLSRKHTEILETRVKRGDEGEEKIIYYFGVVDQTSLSYIEPDLQAGGQNPFVRLFVRHLKTEGKGKSGDEDDDDLNVPVMPPQDVAQQ